MRLLLPIRYRVSSLAVPAIAILFFLSGGSSLTYQVVWMRRLSLFFGSDVYSAAVILSCFMGGLSLGSALIARVADRIDRPLIWYGAFEIVIGVCALGFNTVLKAFVPLYQFAYRQWFDSAPWRYHLFRVGVAAVTLLVPTSLMGATLPLIVRRFVRQDGQLGRFSGLFYAVNTAGALAGVLLVSFVLLPASGVRMTTFIAVAINLAIGAASVLIGIAQGALAPPADVAGSGAAPVVGSAAQVKVALVCIAISGLAALALEVVWTRVLIQSFSATVYSFSIMLCCFLFGIGYGSERASTSIDGAGQPLRVLGYLELALAVTVAIVGILSPIVPAVFGRALWTLTALSHGAFGAASVIAAFMVSTLLIAIPTMLLGATFPAAVRAATPRAGAAAGSTGRVYAANTLGGIAGALVGGMVLIPAFGSRNSLAAIAVIFLGNALWVLRKSARTAVTERHVAIPAVCCLACVAGTFALPSRVVTNFNQQQNSRPEVIYHGEGVAHTIDIVKNQKNDVIMMVDGNIEADTSDLQRRHFILKGHLPLLLHSGPRDVAVVGLGLGITLNATARHPGLRALQVVELTSQMVDAHAHLAGVSDSVLRDPRVHVRIDDGRNFLAMTDRTFDMITADPIHPRISGVGYLYTTEYYESIKRRLRPGGIVCQWMPMYQVSRTSFDVAFRSFASVFPNASFWYVRGHGLFVATLTPFRVDYAILEERFRDPRVRSDLASIHIESPVALLTHMLLGPSEVAGYLASSGWQLNTDDNAYLEYRTPFEFLHPTSDILDALLRHARLDDRAVVNISDPARAELRRRWERRKADVMPEIDRAGQ